MTWLAAAAVAALVVVTVLFLRQIDRQQRQHARERDLLTNQLMHLAGRTWTSPPADEPRTWQQAADEHADRNALILEEA